jgi:hypothetical protein
MSKKADGPSSSRMIFGPKQAAEAGLPYRDPDRNIRAQSRRKAQEEEALDALLASLEDAVNNAWANEKESDPPLE